ncbi:MAG: family 43 glycosylhydrolase [Ruminococcus sp.]|nr:family 43 glycosylhydrolase [Ruminococcus sp.]
MIFKNPVVKGFYPDPSVCFANGKYYMVCSSFQYFPGIPLFESEDLVNWTQIGYVLTRSEQVMLDKINSSGGIFAPTIRFNNGRFYVVTTNDTTSQNFYVYTDDIYGEWSDPIYVDQGGIDPSLYFEKNKCYFMSNGEDDKGVCGAVQCEIDIKTGKKLSESKCIWQGSGGRFLEGPHLYKIGKWYYLMAAEGGTEYGHMITCARSRSLWGRYSRNPNNPVLTNRNKAPYIIQGIGHGDLIQDQNGNWFILSLGFRQIHLWMPFHNLGREVFLTPVKFGEDGWFTAGADGTTEESFEIEGDFTQNEKKNFTFGNTSWNVDWSYMRKPDLKKYVLEDTKATLFGSDITLEDADSPTFLALRQKDFSFLMSADVAVAPEGNDASARYEAGFTVYMCENEHYDVALRKRLGAEGYEVVLKLNIGGIKHVQKAVPIKSNKVKLIVKADNFSYSFLFKEEDENIGMPIGYGYAKYLTSEVSGGFTGVMLGMYAIGSCKAEFENFEIEYR